MEKKKGVGLQESYIEEDHYTRDTGGKRESTGGTTINQEKGRK